MAKSLVASIGMWLVGSLIGRLLYPQKSASKPEDLAGLKVSGPTPGSPIAVLWGTRRLRGHVIWAAAPISRKKGGGGKKSGGKKGGGDNEIYVRSFAHSVCLGPAQLRQILINDEVVWDVDDPSIGTEAGVDVTWHEGTQDQDPDPRMAAQQSTGGGGNNPTHIEQTTLNGTSPTYTVGHLPVVSGSDVVWYIGGPPGSIDPPLIYMQRVVSSPGQDQYMINNTTGLLTFGGFYTSLAITIRYQSGSLTGQQEALGYPNLAYAYWHEFETGTTATIPQATYVCSRLALPAGMTEIGVTGYTMQSTPDPNPDVGNRTTFDLFTVLPTGAVQVLGQYGTSAGSGGTAIDTFDALVWHPDEAVWYCAVSRLTGVLVLAISHRIVRTATLPPPEWQDQAPESIVFERSFTGSWAGFADRIWELTHLNGRIYGLIHSPAGSGLIDVTNNTIISPSLFIGLTAYNGSLYWLVGYWLEGGGDLYFGTYTPATGQWVTLATIPGPSGGISGAKIEMVGTRLYIVNGTAVWRWNGSTLIAQTGLLDGTRQIRELFLYGDHGLAKGRGYIASVPLTGDAWTILDDVGASTATQFVGIGVLPSGDVMVLSQGDGTTPYRLWRLDNNDQLAVVHTFAQKTAKDTSDHIVPGGILGATGYANDLNPVDVAAEIITDDLYGARVGAVLIHQSSLWEMWQHVATHDFLVSGVLEQRTTALALIEQIMAHYMGWLAVRQGLFYFGGRRPETVTREIVLDDMLEDGLLTYSLAGERDTKNKITVDYTDRARGYNSFPVSDADDPDRTQNYERSESITLDWFCTPERAKRMASLLLVLRRVPAMALEAILGPKEIEMAPGDVVAVTVSKLGLFQEPVRILAVGESDREDMRGGFRVAMEREPAGLLEPRTYPIQPPVLSDPPPSPFVPVGPTLAAVWEMPSELVGQDTVRTMFVVSGTHPDWRGAAVYLSLDGGTTYERVATYVGSGAAIGALSRGLPARAAGWFGRDDVWVDVRASAGVLMGATRNSALAGTTLSLLAGEPTSYRDAVLSASGQYRLRGTLRAWFEQPVAAHGVGDLFAFVGAFPGFPAIDHPASRIGVPLVVKAASINQAGREQDLAEAAEIPFTLQGFARMPSPIYGLQLEIGGVRQGSRRIIDGGEIDVRMVWHYARRDNPENADLVDGNETAEKAADWLDYEVRVSTKATSGGSWGLRRTVHVTTEGHTYTTTQNIADNGAYHRFIRFEVLSRRSNGALSRGRAHDIEVLP